MKKYVCPEGDFEQEMPGRCPNHNMDLEEKEAPEEGGMDEESWAADEEAEGEDKPKENQNQ